MTFATSLTVAAENAKVPKCQSVTGILALFIVAVSLPKHRSKSRKRMWRKGCYTLPPQMGLDNYINLKLCIIHLSTSPRSIHSNNKFYPFYIKFWKL